jgi:hypothetical protein
MTDIRKTFMQWLVDEAQKGFDYPTVEDARAAFETAGYSWDGWVKGMSPTINLNGTSGEELLRQVNDVLAALRTAEKAMVEASPHGRDYQLDATGDSYRTARAEHIARLTTLHELIRVYEAQQEDIDNQMMEREARKAR